MKSNDNLSNSPVSFTLAPSHEQLLSFFRLRQLCFREVLGFRNFSEVEDDDDRRAEFVLALSEEGVVGGIRLVFHEKGSQTRLPLEEDDFILERLYPDFHLAQKSYFEVGRLAVSKPFRQPQVLIELYRRVIALGQRQGSSYLFAVSTLKQARYNRRICTALGVDYEIQSIAVPIKPLYEGTAVCLAWVKLANVPDFQPFLAIDHYEIAECFTATSA